MRRREEEWVRKVVPKYVRTYVGTYVRTNVTQRRARGAVGTNQGDTSGTVCTSQGGTCGTNQGGTSGTVAPQ